MPSNIEVQAEFFANIPIIDRKYKSSVHLENESDKEFWDAMLQTYRPGVYFYVYHSKNENGVETYGCTQCLKYRDFLSDNFFICIDSDLRCILKEKNLDSKHFILQTYCYSWESHYCFAGKLQSMWERKGSGTVRDFNFINDYSVAVYETFIHFLIMNRRGFKEFTLKRFSNSLPRQCSSKDMHENGKGCIEKIKQNEIVYVDVLEKANYQRMGLNEGNAYLHINGHCLYDLIKNMGKYLCYGSKIDFEKDILLDGLQTSGYWEVDKIGRDIQMLGL